MGTKQKIILAGLLFVTGVVMLLTASCAAVKSPALTPLEYAQAGQSHCRRGTAHDKQGAPAALWLESVRDTQRATSLSRSSGINPPTPAPSTVEGSKKAHLGRSSVSPGAGINFLL